MSVYFCSCAREMFVKQYFILFKLQRFRLQSFLFFFLLFKFFFFFLKKVCRLPSMPKCMKSRSECILMLVTVSLTWCLPSSACATGHLFGEIKVAECFFFVCFFERDHWWGKGRGGYLFFCSKKREAVFFTDLGAVPFSMQLPTYSF